MDDEGGRNIDRERDEDREASRTIENRRKRERERIPGEVEKERERGAKMVVRGTGHVSKIKINRVAGIKFT